MRPERGVLPRIEVAEGGNSFSEALDYGITAVYLRPANPLIHL